MSRKNIFDILTEKIDVDLEIKKINDLLSTGCVGYDTVEDIINEYCFKTWINRGRFIDCEEIRTKLRITDKDISKGLDEERKLIYLEYISNIIWLCNNRYLEPDDNYADIFSDEFDYLQENVFGLIGDLGYEAKAFDNEEKVILIVKNAATTAAAEIAPPEISNSIIEYNHFTLKGNIEEKRKILLLLADKFEPSRKELGKINSTLESNAGYLLNKMNIRHNNKDGKAGSGYVGSLTDEELEEWYDETYQILLLAMLELDNVKRNKKITQLKNKIEG